MERKFSKNTQYDCLINYIPEPIRKSIGCLKDIIVSLFKTNTSKQIVYGRGNKLSKRKTQNIRNPFIPEENKKNKIKDRIIRDIWKLFETEEEKEERKESEKKKKQNEISIRDKIVRDIRTLFEQEEDYLNLKE